MTRATHTRAQVRGAPGQSHERTAVHAASTARQMRAAHSRNGVSQRRSASLSRTRAVRPRASVAHLTRLPPPPPSSPAGPPVCKQAAANVCPGCRRASSRPAAFPTSLALRIYSTVSRATRPNCPPPFALRCSISTRLFFHNNNDRL